MYYYTEAAALDLRNSFSCLLHFFATFFGCKARYFYFLSLLACRIDLTRRYIFWSSILQGEFWLKAADRKQRLVASSKNWLSNSRMYQLVRVPVDRVDKHYQQVNTACLTTTTPITISEKRRSTWLINPDNISFWLWKISLFLSLWYETQFK